MDANKIEWIQHKVCEALSIVIADFYSADQIKYNPAIRTAHDCVDDIILASSMVEKMGGELCSRQTIASIIVNRINLNKLHQEKIE